MGVIVWKDGKSTELEVENLLSVAENYGGGASVVKVKSGTLSFSSCKLQH